MTDELRRRTSPPYLDGWTLHLAGEPAYEIDPHDHDPQRRTQTDHEDGVEVVLNSLSTPLGIESLAPAEAAPLLAAWHASAGDLDPALEQLWAAPALSEPALDDLAALLAHPAICGLQVPATAMGTPGQLDRLMPLLDVAHEADLPVLVHPGPVSAAANTVEDGLPDWWPALTAYPAQQAAAWHAWRIAGRVSLPHLRIGFVALAGLAPIHHERMAQRGGAMGQLDRDVFYESSSYGPQAIDAMTRAVGIDALVHGSDRPYAAAPLDAALGEAFDRLWRRVNPHRFLTGETA